MAVLRIAADHPDRVLPLHAIAAAGGGALPGYAVQCVLDDDLPAGAGDRGGTAGTVASRPGKHHGDDAIRVPCRGAAKQRVDGRTGAVLARSASDTPPPGVDDEVVVGRSHGDATADDRIAVSCVARLERPGAGEDLGQAAPSVRRDVQDDPGRGGKILR